jgi:hypothetical protein
MVGFGQGTARNATPWGLDERFASAFVGRPPPHTKRRSSANAPQGAGVATEGGDEHAGVRRALAVRTRRTGSNCGTFSPNSSNKGSFAHFV